MFFYLLCSLVLAANLPTIDDHEDKSDAREQRKQEHERFEAQRGSSSVSFIDVVGVSTSIGDGRKEIADANNNAVGEAQAGSSSVSFIDVEGVSASAGDGRKEIADANNNAVGEAQAGSSSVSFIDVEGVSASAGDGREEIADANNDAVGKAERGSSSVSFIDVVGVSTSIGDGRKEIADANNNAVGEAQAGSSSVSFIDVVGVSTSIGDGRKEIADANNDAVGKAERGSSSVSFIDVVGVSASAGDGREDIANANNNAVGEAQRGSSSRIVVDAEEENTFSGDNRGETAGAKNRAANEGHARSKISRVFDVVREGGSFFVPPTSEDTASSPADAGETYFDYEHLKTAVLSEKGAFEPTLGQGTIVVTAEGVDGKKYRWRIAEQVGRGAYGAVYRADKVENLPTANTHSPSSPSSSSSIDRMASVAIKVAWSETARDSLIQEANRLNQMKNTPGVPQLVSVARFDDHSGVLMASEFFPRGDLEHYLKKNPTIQLSPMEMWETAKDAFMKLDAIHQRHKIRHGDIKPSNLFLDDHNKIVFGDWGNGRTFSRLYASEDFLESKQPRFRDDFVSLFLSIFQLDHTLTYDKNTRDFSTRRSNNVYWRVLDQSTGLLSQFDTELSRTASVWDKNLLSSMKKIRGDNIFVDAWITLWSKILNADSHGAGLSDEISKMFGVTCYVF